jgi:uncharacterized membrane protein
MGLTVISLFIAFLGYSVQNISQASQKMGLTVMKKNRTMGILIWSIATVGTGSSSLILLYSISIGQVSLVGAMAGTGLVTMTIFSRLILNEKVGRKEIFGVLLIIIAAFLIGFFSGESSSFAIILNLLVFKLIGVSSLYSILWITFRNKNNILSVILGSFAGAMGGFVSQFQKISTASAATGNLISNSDSPFSDPSNLLNPYTIIWILLSITSMVILQFAHKTGRTLRVIPAFAANFILIPVIGGVTCFGERLMMIQWTGVIVILVGVLLITIQNKPRSESL